MRWILQRILAGFWQGVGIEFSVLVLWVGWHILHKRVAHKFDPEHIFHTIHDYFTK